MKKRWQSGLACALSVAMVIGSLTISAPISVEATEPGTTYYIDAAAGDDANDGKSESAAWKTFANLPTLELSAGDKVLLKAGCTWNITDQPLEINNAEGTAEAPVVLGSYGEGDNPVINGNGNPWQTNVSAPKEDVAAVHVYNSKHIIIENLEVTNWESDAADLMGETSEKVKYDQSKYLLTGILVENHDAGELDDVVIRNNYVHDVNGYMSKNGTEGDKKGSGGIIALVTGGTTESSFANLKIEGNKVEKVCHEAIYMESCFAARTLVGGASSQQAGSKDWVGWKNVYVANNYVNNVAGDGIVMINADGGIAEYNLVTASAKEDWNYSRNPAHAAIWMWDCNNVTMQYNEAAFTESTQDGMAFDCDYGNQNVMYQYNYSHDNKGGFWMSCPGPYYSINAVVRYNVSVNDGLFDGSRIIRVGEKGSIGNQVYNNTIYWDTGYDVNAVEQGSWGTPPTSGTDIYNNIFCGDSGTFVNNDGIHYNSNCVWGSVKDVYPTDEDTEAIVADPQFVDVTDYTTGSFADGVVTRGNVNGFKLKETSPCINMGRDFMAVPEKSLEAVESEIVDTQITLENKDYLGNAVPFAADDASAQYVDIGAFEYQGAGNAPAVVDTDKAYLQALIDMAQGYSEEDYTAATWKSLTKNLAEAVSVADRNSVSQKTVDATAVKLEKAISSLVKDGAVRPGTVDDDILADYNASSTIDNHGFEKSGCDWGYWQSTVSVSDEQAHSGSQSLKVVQKSASNTAYSELGNIPVDTKTDYVLEAWIYYGENDVTKVGLEAKHHKNVTGSNDIKLANKSATADVVEDGWAKVVMPFTTGDYSKISISASSDLDTIYLDDVVLYPASVAGIDSIDYSALTTAMAKEPAYAEIYYSEKSWNNYQKALMQAKLKNIDAEATQEEVSAAAESLTKAYNALTQKTRKKVLSALYNAYVKETNKDYTDASWKAFQAALQTAKTVIDNEDATQNQIDNARVSLVNAHAALISLSDITPAKAALKKLTVVKGKKLNVSWSKVANATGYEIQYSLKKDFKSGVKKITIKNAASEKTTIKGLKKGKVYYVRIRAYTDAGAGKNYGDWSAVKKSKKVK